MELGKAGYEMDEHLYTAVVSLNVITKTMGTAF
jgi:hypothetical protein